MNYKFLTLFFALVIGFYTQLFAQVNRRNSTNIVAYSSKFQRINSTATAYHSFEIRSGTLWAWGFNSYGQLGDSSTILKHLPTQIGVNTDWFSVSAGYYHSLAIKTNGTLWAWGKNDYGQLGDNTNTQKIVPTKIGTDSNWICVYAGEYHSLGIKANGTLWAWGNNQYRQLGIGSTANKIIPTQVGTDNNWTSIIAGSYYSMALKANGTIWNLSGSGTIFNPTQIGLDNKWKAIFGGYGARFALKSDGKLYSISVTFSSVDTINQIGNDSNWVNVAAGYGHVIALKTNGTLWGWGNNSAGQLADTIEANRPIPFQVGSANDWVEIAAGFSHSMAVKANGKFYTWGSNDYGQIGNQSFVNESAPILINTENNWLATGTGNNLSVALKSDGKLWTWGLNNYGQLGIGNNINNNRPQLADTATNFKSFAVGGFHILALKANGTLWSTGYNGYGQLGNGSSLNKEIFTVVGIENNWNYLTAGELNSFAIKSNGTLWGWGLNGNGELGDGTFTSKNNPIQIGNDNKWISVSAGVYHTIALKADGTLWAWGNNFYGQLGDSLAPYKTTPAQIGTDNNWTKIEAGNNYNTAIKSNGTLWAWGRNNFGQLGLNDSLVRYYPTQIGVENNWIDVSCGSFHNVALKSNGSIWAWGNNGNGEFGNGTFTDSKIPLKISEDKNNIIVNAGNGHSILLKSNRKQLCISGLNNFGQIGDRTLTNKNTFTCIKECEKPNAPLVNNTSICFGNNVTVFASGQGSISWYDSLENGNLLARGNSFSLLNLIKNKTIYAQDSSCDISTSRTPLTITVLDKIISGFTINNSNQCLKNNEFIFTDTANIDSINFKCIWKLSNGDTFSLKQVIKKFSEANTVSVKLINYNITNGSCADSVTKNIQVFKNPTVKAVATDTILCEGKPLTLIGNGAKNYNWDNGISNGNAFNIVNSKFFKVLGTDSNNCINEDSIFIKVNKKPIVTATVNFNDVCAKTPIILEGKGALSYTWNNNVINGKAFIASNSDTFRMIGIDSNSCADSAKIFVKVKPLPDVTVSKNKNELISNQNNALYQWLDCSKNKLPIANETSKNFNAKVNGNYAVMVSLNSCIDTSQCENINSIGTNESFKNKNYFSIYPNPTNGIFYIETNQIGNYIIINSIGKIIKEFEVKNENKILMNYSDFNSGIYFIINPENKQFSRQKIVIIDK